MRFSETVFAMVHLLSDLKSLAKGYLPAEKPLVQIYTYEKADDNNYWPPGLDVCKEAKKFNSID